MIELKPMDSLEARVFELLKEDKIPGLQGGHFFQGDYESKGIGHISKPDIVYFNLIDDLIIMKPCDVKHNLSGLKPKQISPLTLEVLSSHYEFYRRMMESLEEYGWQNKKVMYEEGFFLAQYVNDSRILKPNLAYEHRSKKVIRTKESIKEFIRENGFYTVDTVLIKQDITRLVQFREGFKDLQKILKGVDWMHTKSNNYAEILYSASKKYGKQLTSCEILYKTNNSLKKISIGPYVMIPNS